jgi:hypothetical protein
MKIPKFTKWLFESDYSGDGLARLKELGLGGVNMTEILDGLIKRGYRTAKLVGDTTIDLHEYSYAETNWRGNTYKYDFTITDMHAKPDMVRIIWSWLDYETGRNRFGRKNPPNSYFGEVQCLATVGTPGGTDYEIELQAGKANKTYNLGIDATIEAIRSGKIGRY